MIKTLFITFFFAFAVVISIAQTRQAVDSLQHQLASAKDDTSRIDAEIGLCRLYRLGNTDSSLIYGQRALKSAQKINYYVGEIAALSFMCIATGTTRQFAKVAGIGI